MKHPSTPPARIRRTRSIAIAALCIAVLGVTIGVSSALAFDQDVNLAGAGMTELGDPDSTVTAAPSDPPTGTTSTHAAPGELASGPADPDAGTTTLTDAKLAKLTKPQLVAFINRKRTHWLQLQTELGALELTRDAAESEVDASLTAYAARLLALFDGNDTAEVEPLRQVRSESDPAIRASLIAQLRPEDIALVKRYDDAKAAAAVAGSNADAKRDEAAIAAADLSYARDYQDGLTPGNDSTEPAVQANHVFATGPIPSIGYFGATSGDGMLGGWAGLAGAALGGIGCTPPDATLAATGVTEQGIASWYGPGFNGQNTANGETYDQDAMTAAHKSLPFGTIVRVYSNTTARCVFVRINDRGPYVDGRIIDLSHAAANALGMDGTDNVQIEVWSTPGTPAAPIVEPSPDQWPADAGATPGDATAAASAATNQ